MTTPQFVTTDELQKVDRLLGAALVSADVRKRLLEQRDSALFGEYMLTPETQAWLNAIPAISLQEFAEAVVTYA
jgi:hypothetical protein